MIFSQLGKFLYKKEGRLGKSLLLLSFSLACGIAALVALETFSRRIEYTVSRDSKKVLAADFVVRAWRPFDEKVWTALEDEKKSGNIVELSDFVSTLLFEGNQSATVSVRAVGGNGYPFYGDFITEPSIKAQDLSPDQAEIILDKSFRSRGITLGSKVKLGKQDFIVKSFLLEEPQSVLGSFSLGARVIISKKWMESTGLVTTGSRVFQQILIRSSLNSEEFEKKFRKVAPDPHWRLVTPERSNKQVERVMDRMRGFLSFVGIASLFLGSMGLFMVFRSQFLQRLPSYLTLRCLGAKKNSILQAALLNSLQVAVLGSLMGVFLGLGLESYLSYFAKLRFDVELGSVSWAPAFGWGFLLSFLCVGVSVFVPLREILRVPVSQAIRQDESQGTMLNYKDALIALGVAILIVFLVGPAWKMSLSILLGVSVAVVLLFGTGNLLLKIFSRFQFSFAARHASLQLERKKGRTQLLIVTFGLSLFFLFLILFLGKSIRSQIDQINNADFPNVFAINLAPESKEQLQSILPQATFTSTAQARVVEINGKEIVEGIVPEEGEDRFYLTREYVVTKRSELSKGEELIEGKTLFQDSQSDLYQVSLEESFAKQLKLKVGDSLKIDLAGVRLNAVMSSVRKVNWFNFQPNFFIVFNPSELEGAPMNFVATARVPKDKIPYYQSEVAKKIPQATLVDGEALASRLLKIINQLSTAVYAVTLFSLLSCFFVFVGIFLARRVELLKEVSLWRCLGLRNGKILSIYVYESFFLGVLASVTSLLSASLVVSLLCKWVIDIPVQFVSLPSSLVILLIPAVICAVGATFLLRGTFRNSSQTLLRMAEEI